MVEEQEYISKVVQAMHNQSEYIRGYKAIDVITNMILYRVTNITEDGMMIEYFNDRKYNIIFVPAQQLNGEFLSEKCIRPRPFKKIFLNGTVEQKLTKLCEEIGVVLTNVDTLRKSMYYGACGYLKLNNIDITLNRTYTFDDDELIITDQNGKKFNY